MDVPTRTEEILVNADHYRAGAAGGITGFYPDLGHGSVNLYIILRGAGLEKWHY